MEPRAPQSDAPTDGFDAVLERLRGVVEQLEGGSLSLEQSLEAFEEGVRLSRRGAQILDAAEKRVETLMQSDDAPSRTEPTGPGSREAAADEEPHASPHRNHGQG